AGPADPRAGAPRHRECAGGERRVDVQRPESPSQDNGRQSERACPQARGGAVHQLQQIVRGPDPQDRVPFDGAGPARAGALPRPYGSPDPRDPPGLREFFLRRDFMLQSTSLHVAIIMDGNGRWAARRGLPRAAGTALRFRLAVDYSARAAIPAGQLLPDVDLLIRTGGEQRLSDFLLWECAYAELYFTELMWPDFAAADLADALRAFHARQRRFGGLPEAAAG